STAFTAREPADKGMLFEPAESTIYRHPTFYEVPEEVGHM
ncbi:MAG: 1,2-phenylacetyl-CoA epoxidase subunit B, partial [Bradyrhizobium canariense]